MEDKGLCRFCFEEDTKFDKLISPCLCKGSLKYVHVSCFLLSQNKDIFYCSICNSKWGPQKTNKKTYYFDWELFLHDSIRFFAKLLSTTTNWSQR